VSGSSMFPEKDKLYYILAFLSSNVAFLFLSILAPTVNFQIGNIGDLPLIIDENRKEIIEILAKKNIKLSIEDWDNFETSWDFKVHPILKYLTNNKLISSSFEKLEEESENKYNLLKSNEEKINQEFIEIYNIKNDLTHEVSSTDLTLNKSEINREIKSFISYFIGCLFGRYSLDNEGLQFTGGAFNPSNYSKFLPDDDNIIPVLDTDYFEDDIVTRFIEFLKIAFGSDTLEENLSFIASNLGKKGKSNRDIIRNYFLTDFYKNHAKTYKKTPIYWLFSSGKNNGFKALIYMHRYTPDLVARVRTDYLHKTQKAMEISIENCDSIINNSSNNKEIANATKEKNKLLKQLEETRKYDEVLAHIANEKIELDLDDGVKINYEKFQNIEITTDGEKIKKVNLLEKI
ncbi:MAG: restriction endonuclease subunit M, partial [Methanobrevibacter sp.]|nr:restriction endonuclease subunit M [Methanobrevibacter sp.]